MSRPLERQDRGAPVIDWSGTSGSVLDAAGGDSAGGKKKSRLGGWLAEFLGTKRSATTLAEQTGLKVVLDGERRDGGGASEPR